MEEEIKEFPEQNTFNEEDMSVVEEVEADGNENN